MTRQTRNWLIALLVIYSVPVFVVGGKSLGIRGNRHVRYPKGTPLANLMLGMTDRYGVHLDKFGNSNAAIDLTTI